MRVLLHAYRAAAPIVVVCAVIQGLLVLGDPVPDLTAGFGVRVLASFVVLVAALSVTSSAVSAVSAVTAGVNGTRSRYRPRSRIVLWWAVVVALASVAYVLHPLLPVVVAVLGAIGAPGAVDGTPMTALRTPIREPGKSALAVLASIVLIAASGVVALVLGFFVTGVAAAIATWVWFGLVAVVVLTRWTVLYRAVLKRSVSR